MTTHVMTRPSTADEAAALMIEFDDPDLLRFARELGARWPAVAPFASAPVGADWFGQLQAVRAQDAEVAQAISEVSRQLGELGALHAGWSHFSPGKKAVLNAATAYVVSERHPDLAPERELVVSAAVRALLRRG